MPFDFPATPALDQIFTPVGGPTYKWSGSTWIVQTGFTPVPSALIISDTAPPTPVEGDLWWESDAGRLLAWYNDGTSSQWVQISGPMVLPPALPDIFLVQPKVFTASGTYTKPVGLLFLKVEIMGGGGGGGSCGGTGAGQWSCGSGGGAGGYGRQFFDAATLPASIAYTVGAGGGSVAAGGTTTFSTATATGGAPGINAGVGGGAWVRGGFSGTTTGCDVATTNFSGSKCIAYPTVYFGGDGASTLYGSGGRGPLFGSSGPVTGAQGYGAGGGGTLNTPSVGVARPGGGGAPGMIRITEYF